MPRKLLFVCCLLVANFGISQSVSDLINEVDINELTLTLNEFSGEVPTVVDGNTVTILNRVSNSDNNLAADYLLQRFNALSNLIVEDDEYNPGVNGGRNIIATQLGVTNPDKIYIICAHYDSVANYCADDNVSGTAAVLEVARILSQYSIDNTIVYALWDQEEIGLVGSNNYAQKALLAGSDIQAVFNMDMMAHDGDGDNSFDLDTQPIANSLAMKDEIISLLNTYAIPNDIDLNANHVANGTYASDHSAFWNRGYTALLFGEAWSENDQTEDYHSSSDKVSTLDLDYYHDMVKLTMAYMAAKAGFNVLGVNELEEIGVRVFPNPMQNELNVQSNDFNETEISIFNISGKLYKKEELSGIQMIMDVSMLPSGFYFVSLKNSIGQKTIKLIKQ